MDSDEKIKTHLLSVWLEEKRLFARSKECMLFVTDKGLYFVSKTQAKSQWWKSSVQRQILMLLKDPENTIWVHDGYDEKNLALDLENEKNSRYRMSDVISVDAEEKTWGSILVLKLRDEEKERKFHLSIVRDWVSYPVKAPMNYLKVNWTPVVQYIKSRTES
ncbi:MAG: hypothetical protein FJ357_05920 [Thaumarchaeota archaeon]|nr:hypothetical protein [Nitrososphaerota archaeon]